MNETQRVIKKEVTFTWKETGSNFTEFCLGDRPIGGVSNNFDGTFTPFTRTLWNESKSIGNVKGSDKVSAMEIVEKHILENL